MPRPESKKEFIRKLSETSPLVLDPAAHVIGMGQEAVVVASGRSVLKCYSINMHDKTGFRFSSREKVALRAFGGYKGEQLDIPELRSHHRFLPFEWQGRIFTCLTEQSRMPGSRLSSSNMGDAVKLGRAVGEFHSLLSARQHFAKASNPIIQNAFTWCTPDQEARGLPSDLYRRLVKNMWPLVKKERIIAVHGDLHHSNILTNGSKFFFLDHSRTGTSYAEHDMSRFAVYPDTLRDMFKGYAQVSGVKLKKSNAVALYALDLAQISVQKEMQGMSDVAAVYVDELRAVLS